MKTSLWVSRTWKLLLALNLVLGLLIVVPALADYIGPDRSVTTYVLRRKRCHYVAVYDPPGVGYFACTMNLYTTPDGTCPSNVADYFNPTACIGWSFSCSDPGINCSISRSSSLVSCSAGDLGCRSIPQTTTYPPATISGMINCPQSGSAGWCIAGSTLTLTGFEPLAGYSIIALEGTRNGETFACSGDNCSVPLLEGSNAFTYWALSSWGDSSAMGSSSGSVDTRPPTISGTVSGTAGEGGWWISEAVLSASASDPSPGSGLTSFQTSIDGGAWNTYAAPITIGDGVYSVNLRAVDAAGHVTEESQTIHVDTQPPGTVFADPAEGSTTWTAGVIHLAGASADATSGVAAVELSTDGGASWQGLSFASDGAWSTDWDTRSVANGNYSVLARARDAAGNSGNTASVMVRVDNGAPFITMPASWNIWEPVHIGIEEGGIGLERVSLRIYGGDYGTRTYTWPRPPETFVWDRHFGDVVAPIGTYPVIVQAYDWVGNVGSAQGEIVIPAPDEYLPDDAPAVAAVEVHETPPADESAFGGEETTPSPTLTPTDRPQVVMSFGGDAESAAGEGVSSSGEVIAPTGSNNLLWGAAAAALISTVMTIALAQRQKRKEEEARQAAAAARFNAMQEALEKQQARQAALDAQRAAEAARLAAEQQAPEMGGEIPSSTDVHDPERATAGMIPEEFVQNKLREVAVSGSEDQGSQQSQSPLGAVVGWISDAGGWLKTAVKSVRFGNVISAARDVHTTEVGTTIRIFGSRASRDALGLREYVNWVRPENAGVIAQSAGSRAIGALTSSGTLAGITLGLVNDTNMYLGGEYNRQEYAASLTVDTGIAIGSALIAGAVAGAVSGVIIGGTAGTIALPVIGTVSGVVVGAIGGAVAGILASLTVGYVIQETGLRTALVESVGNMYQRWTGEGNH